MKTGHPQIVVKCYSQSAEVPGYAYGQASGCDIRAAISTVLKIGSMERVLVPTGIYLEIPPGYEAQIRPRSGQAIKKGLTIPNAPATIDADYRGEILVACINLSGTAITVAPGEKIAQLVFAPVVQAQFCVLESPADMEQSDRQNSGFGSSGY